jgi:hypothetical protein
VVEDRFSAEEKPRRRRDAVIDLPATYAGRRVREGGGFPGTLRLHTSEDGASAGGAEAPLRHLYPSASVLNVGPQKVPVKI